MSPRLVRILTGAALATLPIVAGAPGLPAALKRPRQSLPRPGLLLVAAILWLAPGAAALVAHGAWSVIAQDAAQLALVVAVLYVSQALATAKTSENGAAGSPDATGRWIAWGLVAGLAVRALLSLVQWLAEPGRVAGWAHHPNSWAAGAVLPVIAVFLLTGENRARLLAAAAAAAVVGATGSRTTAVALFAVAAVWLLLARDRRARRGVRSATTLLVLCLGLALALAMQPRLLASLTDVWSGAESSPTLLGAPQALGVEVSEGSDGAVMSRPGLVAWHRLQYPLILFPGVTYAMSLQLGPASPGASPGVLGVVSTGNDYRLERREGAWTASSSGRVVAGEVAATALEDGWTVLEFELTNVGEDASWLWIGPAPDLGGTVEGASVAVRAPLAVRGELRDLREAAASGLSGGEPALATRQALSRIDAFAAARAAFASSPWLGRPLEPFADYYRRHPPSQQTAIPAHAHNEILATLYSRGLIGAAGLIGIMAWLLSSLSRPDPLLPVWMAALLLAVNSFDTLLWSSGMIYVVAAVAGLKLASATAVARS